MNKLFFMFNENFFFEIFMFCMMFSSIKCFLCIGVSEGIFFCGVNGFVFIFNVSMFFYFYGGYNFLWYFFFNELKCFYINFGNFFIKKNEFVVRINSIFWRKLLLLVL